MSSNPVKLGIVGLGRWATVLTRAVKKSDKLKIVAGYSRSTEKRNAFAAEMGRSEEHTSELPVTDVSRMPSSA